MLGQWSHIIGVKKCIFAPHRKSLCIVNCLYFGRGQYNTRRLAYAIKRYFEVNEKAWEVLIFKGRKRIPIKRTLVVKPEFFAFFKKAYER